MTVNPVDLATESDTAIAEIAEAVSRSGDAFRMTDDGQIFVNVAFVDTVAHLVTVSGVLNPETNITVKVAYLLTSLSKAARGQALAKALKDKTL